MEYSEKKIETSRGSKKEFGEEIALLVLTPLECWCATHSFTTITAPPPFVAKPSRKPPSFFIVIGASRTHSLGIS